MPYFSIGSRDHPRIRGEHRILPPGQTLPGGSSPHTRGARPGVSPTGGIRGIIPAYAGSTSTRLAAIARRPDHPRIRGEHERLRCDTHSNTGSSPHTRGARRRSRAARRASRIIPAYAGSTSSRAGPSRGYRDHPRIRGEHGTGLSPPTLVPGIIPAYAGSTTSPNARACPPRDHPRIRGEHVLQLGADERGHGSSPHTRGAQPRQTHGPALQGIIPAYAGSTFFSWVPMSVAMDHPRIRGEHAAWVAWVVNWPGSSPHTRGAQPRQTHGPALQGIIPAYAGSTFFSWVPMSVAMDHPRIRGEHAAWVAWVVNWPGSSPHTRGAHRRVCRHGDRMGIIPAYAGSTRSRRSGS